MSAQAFIQRWKTATGSELANAQLFVTELCELLELPRPNPATGVAEQDHYVFERRAQHTHGDGSEAERRIDCYKRGSFVLEAKKIRHGSHTKGFDDARLRARAQAEQYARDIPASEGRPPFLIVVDVGRFIELYSEFTQTGATYTPFPDPRSHRIALDDLDQPALQARLKALWLDPLSLNPARQSAKVTREVANALAKIAKSLEAAQHPPQQVAEFLTRCLFTFFAEDVQLLPARSFTELLKTLIAAPEQFVPLVGELWASMDKGTFSIAIRKDVLRFNGKLFKNPEVLPLTAEQITLLHEAALKNWSAVEPAIIGTLLERALNPRERHALGAHYTPRAYVERLVLPTVIEPLRADWANAQAAALTLASEGKTAAALKELQRFHVALCNVRVLDPACGSGNFLYVTLEHLKRLEGEVLLQMAELSDGQQKLETEGLTVDPHQFWGLELNPRAAALAELVLWIGYLQWHFRTRGNATPPLPVLKDFRTIECRDAVLAHDGMSYAVDAQGQPITRWDGISLKPHPVTGEPVPDEAAQTPLEHYANPRQASWPEADFVVGNPPFIGASTLRRALGDGYTEALRAAWPEVPESADFVMHWWQRAADLTRAGQLRRFGLITTNSIRQTFNRRVLSAAMDAQPPLTLAFAIPDHPWTDASDGAAVRIAMTVGHTSAAPGLLLSVVAEHDSEESEGVAVQLARQAGQIHADLSIGANVAAAVALRANEDISNRGVQLFGAGFIVTPGEAENLVGWVSPQGVTHHGPSVTTPVGDAAGAANPPDRHPLIRHYRNGRDLTDTPRGVLVIDAFGLTAEQLRDQHPAVYQWLLERVKPERDNNNRESRKRNWWLFGETNPKLRKQLQGLPRYIATVETAKHRTFQFLDASILPDNMLVAVALNDAAALAVLSSCLHGDWCLANGGSLGMYVGNVRYNKTRCFETFPFPNLTNAQRHTLAELGERLDAHRKRQQAAHPKLTLTGCYNVLLKLRSGEPLNAKEKAIHEQGLCSLLKELHDEIDRSVLQAYGWGDLAAALEVVNGNQPGERASAQAALNAELLNRLVALNAERAAQEAQGQVQWLRPSYQNPQAQAAMASTPQGPAAAATKPAAASSRQPWPEELPQQVAAVAQLLAASTVPLDAAAVAAQFKGQGAWKKRLPQILETLEALGRVQRRGQHYAA